VAWEDPGLILAEAKSRDLRLDIRRSDLGATVPESDDVDGLVVMGGPMGVCETNRYPFIVEECRLIEDLVATPSTCAAPAINRQNVPSI
jgi:GMP synthase (glutamine-hydrolysing)